MSKKQRRIREKRRRHAEPKRPSRRRLAAGAGISLGAALGGTATAQADTIEVDRLDDPVIIATCTPAPGDCSLRQAVDVSNASVGVDDEIVFAAGITGSTSSIDLGLGQGQIYITDAVEINGPGAGMMAVSGNDASRIFNIESGSDPYVEISDLTLRDGSANDGGAIYAYDNATELRISDSVLTGNTATDEGGAIYTNENLVIVDSTLSDNDAGDTGGAISLYDAGLTVESSTLSGNTADDSGGAVFINFGTAEFKYSTLSGNTADESGGAVLAVNDSFVTAVASTVDDNTAGEDGGGILAFQSETVLLNSTVSRNDALAEEGGGISQIFSYTALVDSTVSGNTAVGPEGRGGGIYAYCDCPQSLLVLDSTVTANTTLDGGGISREGGPPDAVYLGNTIVAGNTGTASAPDLDGEFDASFTLVGDASGATINEGVAASNITGVNPQLGPLQANGGPTLTHKPALTSRALDQGTTMSIPYDQRFEDRPFDIPTIANSSAAGADGADMGAVELTAAESTPSPSSPPSSEALSCNDKPATIVGTSASETIRGTKGRDVIRARSGDDVVIGRGGKDLICGDDGDDVIRSGKGADDSRGGFGDDRLRGGSGGDRLSGGDGSDRIFGQGGDDKMFGGSPGSAAEGPSGPGGGGSVNNRCSGGSGADEATGCETTKGVP